MNMWITHNVANTMLTIATRRHVCPMTSWGKLLPGLELSVVLRGVDGRRRSSREFMKSSRAKECLRLQRPAAAG
jgi:hypothetical protein